MIAPVISIFANARGNKTFHHRFINWSYRKRGTVQRTHIKKRILIVTLAKKTKMLKRPPSTPSQPPNEPLIRSQWKPCAGFHHGIGRCQPPRKSVTMMAEPVIMAAYSPRKKSANFIEP